MRVEGDEIFFKTQGDANDDPDITELKEGAIAGKVLITIPFLGYLIDFAKKPMGFAMLVIIPVAIVIIDEIRKILAEIKKIHAHRLTEKGKKEAAEGRRSKDPFVIGKSDSEPASAKSYDVAKIDRKDPFVVGKNDSEKER